MTWPPTRPNDRCTAGSPETLTLGLPRPAWSACHWQVFSPAIPRLFKRVFPALSRQAAGHRLTRAFLDRLRFDRADSIVRCRILHSDLKPLRAPSLAEGITALTGIADILLSIAISWRESCRAGLIVDIALSVFCMASVAVITRPFGSNRRALWSRPGQQSSSACCPCHPERPDAAA